MDAVRVDRQHHLLVVGKKTGPLNHAPEIHRPVVRLVPAHLQVAALERVWLPTLAQGILVLLPELLLDLFIVHGLMLEEFGDLLHAASALLHVRRVEGIDAGDELLLIGICLPILRALDGCLQASQRVELFL